MKKNIYYITLCSLLLTFVACSKSTDSMTPDDPGIEDNRWIYGDWIYTSDIIKGKHMTLKENGDYYDDIDHEDPDGGVTKRGTFTIQKTDDGKPKIVAKAQGKDYFYCYEVLKHDDSTMDVFFYLHYFQGRKKGEKNHNLNLSLRKLGY